MKINDHFQMSELFSLKLQEEHFSIKKSTFLSTSSLNSRRLAYVKKQIFNRLPLIDKRRGHEQTGTFSQHFLKQKTQLLQCYLSDPF